MLLDLSDREDFKVSYILYRHLPVVFANTRRLVEEQKVICQLNFRRFAIMKFFLGDVNQPTENVSTVWIDGNVLRRIISCQDIFDDLSFESMFNNNDVMCAHATGVHPRKAHTGKLINEEFCISLFAVLNAERRIRKPYGPTSYSLLFDSIITKADLKCATCDQDYRKVLTQNKASLEQLRHLHFDLILNYQAHNQDKEEIFAVASAFITSFHQFAKHLFKEITDDNIELFFKGLSSLSCYQLRPWLLNEYDQNENKIIIDPTVNGRICCRHQRCNVLHHRNKIKFLSKHLFLNLKNLFPEAIPLPVHYKDGEMISCELCSEEKNFQVQIPVLLQDLFYRHVSLFDNSQMSTSDGHPFWVVWKSDFDSVMEIGKLIMTQCPPRKGREVSTGQSIIGRVIEVLYHDEGKVESNTSILKWPQHSLVCVHNASRISNEFMTGRNSCHIELLSEENFKMMLSFILRLQMLLERKDISENEKEFDERKTLLQRKFLVADIKDDNIKLQTQKCGNICCDESKLVEKYLGMSKTKETTLKSPIHYNESTTDPLCNSESKSDDHTTIPSVQVIHDAESNDDYFQYKVYSFDESHTLLSIQKELEKLHEEGMEKTTISLEKEDQQHLRRSTRKKNRVNKPIPTEFKGKKTNNVAWLRLRIHELFNNTIGRLSNQNISLFQYRDDGKSLFYELNRDANEKTIKQILEFLNYIKSEEVILVLMIYRENSKKRQKIYDGNDEDEAYLDELLSVATMNEDCSEGINVTRRNQARNEEIGFRGTLLQSNFSVN